MEIGISAEAAALWLKFDSTSYNELFVEEEGGYVYFSELPGWAYSADDGPFYIDDDGAIYSISTRPSQDGKLIGNMI